MSSITESLTKSIETLARNHTLKAVTALAEKYGFPVEEAIEFLGLPPKKNSKKEVEKEVVQPSKKRVKMTEEEKATKKAQADAERAEKKAQLDALKAEKKAQADAERAEKKAQADALKAEKKAQAEALKAEKKAQAVAELAESNAKKQEEQANRVARIAEKEQEKLLKEQTKKELEEAKKEHAKLLKEQAKNQPVALHVVKIKIDGESYFINKATKTLYNMEKKEVGTYDETNKKIIHVEEINDEETEEETEEDDDEVIEL